MRAFRGTETAEQIEKRLKTAETEVKVFKEMGVYTEIVNDDFEECYQRLLAHLKGLYPRLVNKESKRD